MEVDGNFNFWDVCIIEQPNFYEFSRINNSYLKFLDIEEIINAFFFDNMFVSKFCYC